MGYQFQFQKSLAGSLPGPIDLADLVPNAWQGFYEPEQIADISKRLVNPQFLPDASNIFNALTIEPEKVKVVILGQDPYPNRTHAMGLAFSVPESVNPLPASLRNIFQELATDLDVKNLSGDLSNWKNQGVLLLNRILTVQEGNSLAHKDFGWQRFTEKLISNLNTKRIVGILWGRYAQELSKYFPKENLIMSAHPSPLSAHNGFFGSKPFSKCNKRLLELGLTEIDWRT